MIHPQACVDGTVTIGEGTRVWQFASVIRGAVIGCNNNIASCAIVDAARLGDGCIIGHGASVHPGAYVGSDVFIGPGAVLCNDVWPRTHKSGFDIKAYEGRPAVIVDDGASIGANSVILPGVHIGAGAMVAAGSVVTRDVPAGFLWKGSGDPQRIASEDQKKRMRHAQVSVTVPTW